METDLDEIECSMSPEQRRALKRFDENQAEQRRLFLRALIGGTALRERRAIGSQDAPSELNTEEAQRLWKKAQEKGWVDKQWQPLLSRSQAALLAATMAKRLGIANKWKAFEGLWGRRGIRGDYNRAMNQRQSLDFQDELRHAFGAQK